MFSRERAQSSATGPSARPLRAVLAWATLVLSAAPAAAQAPPSGGSLWQIMRQGMEWPAYLILAGSVALIALIAEHFLAIRRATIAPAAQVRKARALIERRAFRECIEQLRKSRTFFARTMSAAMNHARHGFDAMHEAALEKSSELSGHLYRKAEYMNILGNLGPLMGLLGTVLGMIYAFGQLGQTGGEAGAEDLARGISLALVNTLLGLALAILGLGFFGVCRNRIESLTVQATVEALDLLEYFRPAPTLSATAPAAAPPPPKPAGAPTLSSAGPATLK
ncbi:MAG: MotA/TolQ/ExbB proton channel family protein [Phycisphaerae bacterium]